MRFPRDAGVIGRFDNVWGFGQIAFFEGAS